MLFQGVGFLCFLAVVLGLYWPFPRARLALLGLANAAFYLVAGWANLALFLVASGVTYALGQAATGAWGRAAVGLGIGLNVANLAWFKYAGFAAASMAPWLPVGWLDPALAQAILLPIGISFYTFQHISYLVDRRTRDLPPAPSYLHFWVYIGFFGHSIAGPIMRGHEFFPQIAETAKKTFSGPMFRLGLGLFALGLVKKLALADHLAPHVDALFARPAALGFGEAWVAAALFAFQIYYDFSAYSDMAVGIGLMFGYTLRRNFLTPYMAADPGEFWRRWHVTLSEWIRDYVYIPLGGNRAGPARAQLNLALAMLASGLWHGASWTFVLWGAWHAGLLVAHRGWRALVAGLGLGFPAGRVWRGVATGGFFVLVAYGWVLFRAPTLDDAALMLATMADPRRLPELAAVGGPLLAVAALYALHVLEWAVRRDEPAAGRFWLMRVPVAVQAVAYAGLAFLVLGRYDSAQDFIYFRF